MTINKVEKDNKKPLRFLEFIFRPAIQRIIRNRRGIVYNTVALFCATGRKLLIFPEIKSILQKIPKTKIVDSNNIAILIIFLFIFLLFWAH